MAVISFGKAFAQDNSGSISGMISTADDKPAEGVTILIKDINKNAIAENLCIVFWLSFFYPSRNSG